MGQFMHRRIRELTGNDDPYREAKQTQNRTALKLLAQIRREWKDGLTSFDSAVRMAIAGNAIDLAVKAEFGERAIQSSVMSCLDEPLLGDLPSFRQAVDAARSILYLTDNAGEIVFDRVLIELLPRKKMTVAVRGHSVINDATMVDAETAGITDIVTVIDNGSDAPGTILEDCSDEFKRLFASTELIIAKGQGNYETLRDASAPIYFLLRVKCPILARDLGCPVGRMVIRSRDGMSLRSS